MDKEFSFKEYREKIIPIIKEKKGIVMPADIALKTNYPIVHIKYTLNKLASEYYADITPTEDGDLLYKFDPNLVNINKKISGYFKLFILYLGKFLKKLFKILIMLTLVGYTVFYVILILALIFGSKSNDSDSDVDIDLSGVASIVFRLIIDTIYYSFWFRYDPYERYSGSNKRPFHIRVFSFVFGDDVKEKPLDHENNVLKYIKNNNQITFSEALNLTGESEENVKKLLVDITVKYEGEIEVNDEGVIIYRFDNLNFTDDKKENFYYIWEKEKFVPKLNYNTSGENAVIIGFNSFNLIAALVMTFGFKTQLEAELGSIFWITTFPILFSVTFFAIPAIRYFNLKKKLKEVDLFNRFKEKLYHISQEDTNTSSFSGNSKELLEHFYQSYPDTFELDFERGENVLNTKKYHDELNSNLNKTSRIESNKYNEGYKSNKYNKKYLDSEYVSSEYNKGYDDEYENDPYI